MDKIREVLLKKYKKASEPEKQKMAEKYGFATAADFYADLTGGVFTVETNTPTIAPSLIDVVVAFDTTGSMSSYIGAVRSHVRELIPSMFSSNPNLLMKIVAFGDYCDMTTATIFGNAYQETPLTDNQNTLISFVNGSQNTSGGDSDEFYELVIKKVVEETPWRFGSKRLFILIADYTPHPLGYSFSHFCNNNQIDWRAEARKAASLGIQIDTFKIIPSHTWYDELSHITNGVSLPFQSSQKTAEAVTASYFARTDSVAFNASFRAATKRGDEEMIGVYKSLSSKIDE